MISPRTIFKSIESRIKHERGKFILSGENEFDTGSDLPEISPSVFLLPLINAIDESWPFDVEPDPRVAGMLVEILRGCRFVTCADGEIGIIHDVKTARNLGAFDTPGPVVRHITETVIKSLFDSGRFADPPVILDPACGAGYFLIDAIDILAELYPDSNPELFLKKSLTGFDIDPVAVKLAKRNISYHLKGKYGLDIGESTLNSVVQKLDALSDFKNLPIGPNSIDGVIGNPPYQFYSGKGSPVKALRKAGKLNKATELLKELDTLTERFPESSIGCRDRYKWFINRSVEFISPGGILGFITPNTWLQYQRYRDIRSLLVRNGSIESVIDLGSLAFDRAHVPASILIWVKGIDGFNKPFPITRLSRENWENAISGEQSTLKNLVRVSNSARINCDSDIERIQSDENSGLHNFTPAPHRKMLGELTVLREGSHAIKAVPIDVPRTPSGENDYPVMIDKTMKFIYPPELGFIPAPSKPPANIDQHTGERFLIRKTGDRLVVAPSPTESYALAHQNVYVGKMVSPLIPFHALVGILGSDLLTGIYRAGPGGQKNRPLAQLRIHFLNKLPVVTVPEGYTEEPEPSTTDIRKLINYARSGELHKAEPIPVEFPSDIETARKILGKIKTYHAAISVLVIEIIMGGGKESMHVLNELVYNLYGGVKPND